MAWQKKTSNCYLDKVRNGRSEGLLKYINECLKGIKTISQDKSYRPDNNLTQDQRDMSSQDESIVIKPSGPVVVMDTISYENACLDHLMNEEFYQEYLSDQNTCHRETIDKEVKELKRNRHITNFEKKYVTPGQSLTNLLQ